MSIWVRGARKLLAYFLDASAFLLCLVFGLLRGSRWSAYVAARLERLFVEITDRETSVRYLVSNPLLWWRADTLLSKEPETIKWLRSMSGSDILFDVGANMGLYSIYAAKRGVRVFAFEPESTNYALLNRNIQANGLSGKVEAFCVAISDRSMVDRLRLSATVPGSGLHSFGENRDGCGQPFSPVFEQGCLAFSLDELIYDKGFPCPNYLKVDVDGLESKVIAGAQRLLSDPRLKGVLLELNDDLAEDQEAMGRAHEAGFVHSAQGDEVRDLRFGMRIRNHVLRRA